MFFATDGIGKRCAHIIKGSLFQSVGCAWSRNDKPMDICGGHGLDRSKAIHIVDIFHGINTDEKEGISIVGI